LNHFAMSWQWFTLLSWLPAFINSQLHFDVQNGAWIATMPIIAVLISTLGVGPLADWLIARKYVSLNAVRQIAQTIGFLGSSGSLIMAGLAHSVAEAMTWMVLSFFLGGFCIAGFETNYLDICPTYAGILYGIGNTLATVTGIVSPALTGFMLNEDLKRTTRAEWMRVFYLSAAIQGVALVSWWFFMSSTIVKKIN